MSEFVSESCKGVLCHVRECKNAAVAKLGEEIAHDDPFPNRHNLTAYVCRDHFVLIMGTIGPGLVEDMRVTAQRLSLGAPYAQGATEASHVPAPVPAPEGGAWRSREERLKEAERIEFRASEMGNIPEGSRFKTVTEVEDMLMNLARLVRESIQAEKS